MGAIALMAVLVYFGPPILVFVVILIASARGYPRRSGRRAYAIAVVPLALFSVGVDLYVRAVMRGHTNHYVLPPALLFCSAIISAAASLACLFAALLYGAAAKSLR